MEERKEVKSESGGDEGSSLRLSQGITEESDEQLETERTERVEEGEEIR